MIEVTLFGWFLGTLASALSVLLLVVALSSVAFLGFTILSAIQGARRQAFFGVGAGASALAFLASLAGLRVGGLLGSVATSAALGVAVGGAAGCLALAGSKGLAALAAGRTRRIEASRAANIDRHRALEEGRRLFLEGGDLRAEVAEAEASLERLRGAIQALEGVRRDLAAKLEASKTPADDSGPGGATAPSAAVTSDYARLAAEVALKVDLGRRLLTAAEAAAFRLACFEPLRLLLRRRPQGATIDLARAATAAELEERIDRSADAIKAFLGEVAGARASLGALEARRPPDLPPSPLAPGASGSSGASGAAPADPWRRACAEVDAVESAYSAVLERTHVLRLRLATRAGMEQVASAAGALEESARALGADEGELRALLEEVARAESAMTISAPDGGDVRALTDALARSADALDRDGGPDASTLDELLRAMRELD